MKYAFGFLVAILLPVVVHAEFDEGMAAYYRGDYETAYREFLPLAQQGDTLAQYRLGMLYAFGTGVPQNLVEAAKWYRLAAEQGDVNAQYRLGMLYAIGTGVPQDYKEAVKWLRLAALQGDVNAQYYLGWMYEYGEGVPQEYTEAMKWYRLVAKQGYAFAQYYLGVMYDKGEGVPQDDAEAVKWYRLAAEQGYAAAQVNLGVAYDNGEGVPQDYVQAHLWWNLAAAQGNANAIKNREIIAGQMTPAQLAEAQQLAREWQPQKRKQSASDFNTQERTPQVLQAEMVASGTGIVVSSEGHVVTNHHVIAECTEVRIPPSTKAVPLVADDPINDLALLISNDFKTPASFRAGRGIQQGENITVVGFPLHGLLASGLNVTTGNVSALAGLGNDTGFLQITAPVQPGNSGGPLLDTSGHIVGIVVSKLNAIEVAQVTGDIPQNINFAINASVVRNFLDANSIAYVTAPSGKTLNTADITQQAKGFTVLVECWK